MSVTFAFYIGLHGTLRDKAVCAATLSRFSHVEFLTAGGPKRSNICIGASLRDGGCVRQKEIEWNPKNWRFVTLQGYRGDFCFKRASARLCLPYSKWAAIRSVFPFPPELDDCAFCGWHAADALNLKDPQKYTPGSLYRKLIQMGGQEYRISERGFER